MIVDKHDIEHLLSCVEYETEYDGQMIRICGSCGNNLDYTGKHETDCTAERLRKKIKEFTEYIASQRVINWPNGSATILATVSASVNIGGRKHES